MEFFIIMLFFFAVVAVLPIVLRFFVPLLGAALLFLFIFGTGGVGGFIALFILICCYVGNGFRGGE